ncbi:mesoderm induction early response protein 1-like [Amphibalanus amphitrite]|uniref:mesoderm induction early response protein 1-like n=1 Tax=Amphibalanus amphitrite TaxID=1232801 RepID=UPI001C91EEE8|nr:mesoderm induction early response protein 1-like [Amphibalanus amphitrite]
MSEQTSGRDQPSPAGSDRDREFEPTVDMMVNDFDDEGTLDEAEANETAEQQRNEADLLQQEQDMPIEKLLAMYGRYPDGGGPADAAAPAPDASPTPDADGDGEDAAADGDDAEASQSSSASEEAASTQAEKEPATETEASDRDGADAGGPPPAKKARRSALSALYPELEPAGAAKRALRSEAPADDALAAGDDGDESDSSESSGEDSNWRKTIMIGSVYQAAIPDGLSPYGDTPPYENEDRLLWDPAVLRAADVETYLRQVQDARLQQAKGVSAVPNGCHIRDNEQALFLLQQCGHSVEEALRRTQMNNHQQIDTLSLWSEEECANFENGLRFYGKDFYTIQQQKVRTRSVGELVQFYYLWKKTERHDVFANKTKMEKRKYALNPGVTDYMDRFLEEQDRDPSTAGGRGDGDSLPSLQILMATEAAGAQLKRWPAALAPPGSFPAAGSGAMSVMVGAGGRPSPSKLLQQ